MIEPEEIRRRIESAIEGAVVEVRDVTGTKDHYAVTVVAPAFEGRSALDRHRMVYAPLQDVLGGALHALSLATKAPGE